MRSLIVTALLALTVSACGGSSDEKPAAGGIDRAAWKAELTQLDDVGPDPDLDELERLTRADCKAPVDDLALRFTLEGARPDVSRINMKYVCPDQAGKVDDALEQGQDASSAVDDACALPEAQRTEDQQALVELAGRTC
jgi:hypothetical protein